MEYKKKYKFEESKNLDTLISKRLNGSIHIAADRNQYFLCMKNSHILYHIL